MKIIKTSHVQTFLFFSIMERIRKGSDLPKKKGVIEHPTKIFADQVTAKLYILSTFDSVCALEIHDVACATSNIACALEIRSSNGRERP